jgi:hypothetical protein
MDSRARALIRHNCNIGPDISDSEIDKAYAGSFAEAAYELHVALVEFGYEIRKSLPMWLKRLIWPSQYA